MNWEVWTERLFQALVSGDRAGCRAITSQVLEAGATAEDIAHELYWPILEMIDNLFRSDQLSTLAHHYAVRLMRSLVAQLQLSFAQRTSRDRSVLMFCGPSESEELAAQLVADLVEADGYELRFGGGRIANDELLAEVGQNKPDVLLLFASGPSDAPHIRTLIDTIRRVDACPNLQVVVGGGVFNRAEGLAEEIGADVWARDGRELIERLESQRDRRASQGQRTVGRNRRNAKTIAA